MAAAEMDEKRMGNRKEHSSKRKTMTRVSQGTGEKAEKRKLLLRTKEGWEPCRGGGGSKECNKGRIKVSKKWSKKNEGQ